MRKRKFSSTYKFNTILESIEKDDVVGVARRNNLDPNMISRWRGYFKKHGHEIFTTNSDKEKQKLEKKIAELERLIGHKEVEIKLLQNFFTHYKSESGIV